MADRIAGTLGDVNPVEYGGGVIWERDGRYTIQYTHGPCDDSEEGSDLEVYVVDVPDDVATLLSDTSWADWPSVNHCMGRSEAEFADQLGEATLATGDKRAQLLARFLEDVASYYGWNELDNYPITASPSEVERMMSEKSESAESTQA